MNTLHYGVWPANRPHFLTVPQMNVSENLRISAMRYRAKTAMIFYDSTMTYGALDEAVDHLAGFLTQDLGVRRGDRVLLYLQNSPQFVISFYAILRANAIVVPVSPALMSEELAYFVEDAGAKVMIGGQDNLARITPLIGKTGLQQAIITAYSDALTQPTDLPMPDFLSAPNQVPQMAGLIRWNEALGKMRIADPITTGPDDLAVFPYTSGTTGRPKGCMHTHRSVMFNIAGATSWRASSTPDAMVLAALPFFHVTGMQGIMNASIYAGATLVLLPRWDRTIAARMIERYRISDWTAITTMVVDFLSNPELERFDISSLTRLGGGGAAMPRRWRKSSRSISALISSRAMACLKPWRLHIPIHRTARRSSALAFPFSIQIPASSTPIRLRNCRRASRARSSSMARRCFRVIGMIRTRRSMPSSSMMESRFSALATSAISMRKAISSIRTA